MGLGLGLRVSGWMRRVLELELEAAGVEVEVEAEAEAEVEVPRSLSSMDVIAAWRVSFHCLAEEGEEKAVGWH